MRLFILITVTFLGATIYAQDLKITNIIATNYEASESDILEIQFANQLPNIPFILAWQTNDGQQHGIQLKTTKDNLSINLSNLSGWEGSIDMIGISINNVKGVLRKPTVKDEIYDFLRINQMTPGSTNFTGPYIIYNIELRWICLFLMVVVWLICYLSFRKYGTSFLIALTISLFIYDLRGSFNRWSITSTLSENDYQIPIFKDLDVFVFKARDIIGDKCWSKEPLSGVLNSYCTYHLSDLCYKPASMNLKKEADYIITNNPGNRQTVLREGPYYLVVPQKSQ